MSTIIDDEDIKSETSTNDLTRQNFIHSKLYSQKNNDNKYNLIALQSNHFIYQHSILDDLPKNHCKNNQLTRIASLIHRSIEDGYKFDFNSLNSMLKFLLNHQDLDPMIGLSFDGNFNVEFRKGLKSILIEFRSTNYLFSHVSFIEPKVDVSKLISSWQEIKLRDLIKDW